VLSRDCPPDLDHFRVAFFLHHYDPHAKLTASYGELACPPVSEMPDRFRPMVPYAPVD